MSRNSREDVVLAAGRLFARNGYDATSMRDLGAEVGLLGSSLYSHIGSKQDLLVEVVRRGGELFQASASAAVAGSGLSGRDRLRSLVGGHIDVVLDHRDEVRTFLNEAKALDGGHRSSVLAERNAYEETFRQAIRSGHDDGSVSSERDPTLTAIFLLSLLNAIDRWYSSSGLLSRDELVGEVMAFAAL
jgi:AcrR family transcriptional regulator